MGGAVCSITTDLLNDSRYVLPVHDDTIAVHILCNLIQSNIFTQALPPPPPPPAPHPLPTIQRYSGGYQDLCLGQVIIKSSETVDLGNETHNYLVASLIMSPLSTKAHFPGLFYHTEIDEILKRRAYGWK